MKLISQVEDDTHFTVKVSTVAFRKRIIGDTYMPSFISCVTRFALLIL